MPKLVGYDWDWVVVEVLGRGGEDDESVEMDLLPVALCAIEAHASDVKRALTASESKESRGSTGI